MTDSLGTNGILGSYRSDFFKMFFPTIIVFFLSFFFKFSSHFIFYFIIAFFLDAGHVYSTMLEVYFDKEEVKKSYVYLVTLGSFLLNLSILLGLNGFFYHYIFYFTVYHNMRQGLGVVYLYKKNNNIHFQLLKWLYYFTTLVPLLIFHFYKSDKRVISDVILRNFELITFFPEEVSKKIYLFSQLFYWLFLFGIFIYLYRKKEKSLFVFIFYSLVYAMAFLVVKDQIISYSLLILSHGIPYFFLFEKRIRLTHLSEIVKKFSSFFVLLFFSIGALVDYYQDDILALVEGEFMALKIVMAILFTPLISHFIFDAYLWTKENKRFVLFQRSC